MPKRQKPQSFHIDAHLEGKKRPLTLRYGHHIIIKRENCTASALVGLMKQIDETCGRCEDRQCQDCVDFNQFHASHQKVNNVIL
jgi:hypothetical protein